MAGIPNGLFRMWLTVSAIASCTPLVQTLSVRDDPQPRFATTYERLLPIAHSGDPQVQNLIGFMFFHGEGVGQDREEAHTWFHRAAQAGNVTAQRNLGIFHSNGIPGMPPRYADATEANLWFSRAAALDPGAPSDVRAAASRYEAPADGGLEMEKGEIDMGEKVFTTFCAGCHGFDGIAYYPAAPSFALGERLEKSDAELLHTMLEGRGAMSAWGGTLSEELLSYALLYLRASFPNPEAVPRAPFSARRSEGGSVAQGEVVFATFCAGCHGFNGISYYVNSPSFALGERMEKSDHDLVNSIRNGTGVMPGWGGMLSSEEIASAVSFIRTLEPSLEEGISLDLRSAPGHYYLFRPLGERGLDWHVRGTSED